MSARVRAVAWDVDGTLVDSEPLHERCLLEVCADLGAETADLGGHRFRGIHMAHVWEAVRPRLPAALTMDAWTAMIRERYVGAVHTVRPLPGALEAIAALAEAGVPQACVSNSEREVVDANLAALGIADLVAFSIAFEDVARGKPDPEPYALAARWLGLPPGEIAAVEDSVTGAASARAAGLRVFAVLPDGQIAEAERTVTRIDDLLHHLLPRAGLAG